MAPRAPPPTVPSVAETLKHPAFETAMWRLEPDRQGLARVAEDRGGPFNISWEIHGEGPIKLIVSSTRIPPSRTEASKNK